MPGSSGEEAERPRLSPRNKRAEIVAVATELFGETGYEDTKWADVAGAVGLGPTALYHYFESKQQCLFEILGEAVEEGRGEFARLAAGDFAEAFPAIVQAAFVRDGRAVRRTRVLAAEQGLVRHPREGEREEAARLRAYSLVKEYEASWRDLLSAGMAAGAIPQADPLLLARAVIGTYNSVWLWYRPDGELTLAEVADFYVPRLLALAGQSG
jgi:TetR/AcrR family transcriptional regulator, cholesterol catabolism regulator